MKAVIRTRRNFKMNFVEALKIGVDYANPGDLPSAESIFLQLFSQFPESKFIKHPHGQVEGALPATIDGTLVEKNIIQDDDLVNFF